MEKPNLYITCVKNGYKFNDHLHFQEATKLVSGVIAKRKHDYRNKLTSKLNTPFLYITTSKFCLRLAVLTFFSFLSLKCS